MGIFFDLVQKKWHMGGKDGLMYRNPSTNRGEVPSGTDDYFCNNCYFQRTDMTVKVCKCRAGVCLITNFIKLRQNATRNLTARGPLSGHNSNGSVKRVDLIKITVRVLNPTLPKAKRMPQNQ